ncbi:sensor domain-containing protein [Cryobacterium tepidiphilum]|nr:EAL domain-containing protein [Cryobacterium tepidiphilum]
MPAKSRPDEGPALPKKRRLRRRYANAGEMARLQADLLNAVNQSVIALDTHGVIVFWNTSSEELYGWTADEVVGARFSDLGVADPDDRNLPRMEAAVRAGEPWSGEHRARHRNGTSLRVHVSLTQVPREKGRPAAILVASTDIAGRKRDDATRLRLAQLVESSDYALNELDLDGNITSWNAGAERLYGYSAAEMIGQPVSLLNYSETRGSDQFQARLEAGEPVVEWDAEGRHKDGSRLHVLLTLTATHDEDGRRTGTAAIARDITERKRLLEEVERERDRLNQAQRVAHVGSIEVDLLTGEQWCSDEACRIHGLSAGSSFFEEAWQSALHPDDRMRVAQRVLEARERGTTADFTYRVVRPAGGVTWVQMRLTAEHDDAGVPVRLVGTTLDITATKEIEAALEHQAYTDALTGLANRAFLTLRIESALRDAETHGQQVALFFLDIDRLKVVNDGMGHSAGDDLLVQLANRLRGHVRPEDTLARFAGDEFVVVCPDMTERKAQRLAERLATTAHTPFELGDREVFVTMSIGMAISTPGDTASMLLHHSDAAMYRAKSSGRNEAVFFDEEMHRSSLARMEMQTLLPRAIERGELRVHYQPLVDIDTGEAKGFEALVRWEQPGVGLVSPDDFIPLAEESGQIVAVGEWVLGTALADAQYWRSTVPGAADLRIAINLSARQLQHPGLVDMVAAALASSGMDPAAVELEITETVLMDDVKNSLDTLTRLRRLGVGVAIDDFGTGYSSLSYLRQLPVTTLKIDGTFIDGLGGAADEHARPIVEAIISLARALGLSVIAEGVETTQQLTVLRKLDARLGQGYHWARPMPYEDVAPWLRAQGRSGLLKHG